jgi:hypothetical protein
MTDHAATARLGWQQLAPDLARWTSARLVNRTDVWGAYKPLPMRAPDKPSIYTAPAVKDRGKRFLTEGTIARHFAGSDQGHLIGLHSTSAANTSRWGAADVDWHGAGSPDPAANLTAALAWYAKLRQLGFYPLLTDSNGRGGYHLLALFSEPAPTARVHAFLRWLVSDYREHGLTAAPEVFPKQAAIAPGRYGNWLRLPGRHHTREHWSRVWNGSAWLEGMAAADYLLSVPGSAPALIPAGVALYERPAPVGRAADPGPSPMSREEQPFLDDAHLERRVTAYLAKLPRLGEGQGRDTVAFGFAAWLVRDLGLTDGEALPWLICWDAGNQPPKGVDRLREILANVHHYGQNAYGSGRQPLPPRRHRITVLRVTVRI